MTPARTAVRTALGTLILAGLVACSGGDESASPKTEATPARQAPDAPSEPTGEVVAEYHYDPTGKPDPFRSFVKELARLQTAATATPLERFDLSQLSVSAVIWGNESPRALVNDPSGKGYIVAEGTPVGKNDGRIIAISDGRVVVKETYVDFEGQATTKDVELRLAGR